MHIEKYMIVKLYITIKNIMEAPYNLIISLESFSTISLFFVLAIKSTLNNK